MNPSGSDLKIDTLNPAPGKGKILIMIPIKPRTRDQNGVPLDSVLLIATPTVGNPVFDVSKEDGYARLDSLQPGWIQIITSKSGYKTVIDSVYVEDTLEVDITMVPD